MKLLMIDNYDSFTFNLVQYFGELGAEVQVLRNDEIDVAGITQVTAGDMDVAIAIRTGIVKDGMLYVQAAAGVVADSVPELEWRETEAKARALLRAAELVEEGLE